MQKTISFNDLEPHFKQVLHSLYISYLQLLSLQVVEDKMSFIDMPRYFYERQEDLWSQIGRTRLPVIRSCTSMAWIEGIIMQV